MKKIVSLYLITTSCFAYYETFREIRNQRVQINFNNWILCKTKKPTPTPTLLGARSKNKQPPGHFLKFSFPWEPGAAFNAANTP